MANKRITELTDIGTPDPLDVLEIVDVSDTTDSPEGTSKKVKVSELGGGGGGSQDLQSVLDEGKIATFTSADGSEIYLSMGEDVEGDVASFFLQMSKTDSFSNEYYLTESKNIASWGVNQSFYNLITETGKYSSISVGLGDVSLSKNNQNNPFSVVQNFKFDDILSSSGNLNITYKPNPKTVSGTYYLATTDDITGGATNLGYTASPTNGIVTSDTGTDATIPLATGTNAGLSLNDLTSALKTAYDNAVTWVTNAGANIRSTVLTGLSTATATTILATDSILTAFGKLQGNLNTRTLPLISDGSVTSITGVNVPTIMYSFQIPENLLNDYNRLVSQIQVTKASGSGSSSISYHINNTNSLSGAVQIAISLLTSTIQFASLERKFKVTGTELSGYPFAASAATDSQNSGASRSTTPYNTTNAIWFIVAVNPASVGESHFLESVEINARRRKTSL
jgi:hypothetical protein